LFFPPLRLRLHKRRRESYSSSWKFRQSHFDADSEDTIETERCPGYGTVGNSVFFRCYLGADVFKAVETVGGGVLGLAYVLSIAPVGLPAAVWLLVRDSLQEDGILDDSENK
jgi:hypothetical protein